MRLRIEATSEELREKREPLLKALVHEFQHIDAEFSGILEKALPQKERALKYRAMEQLKKLTTLEYVKTLDAMVEAIGKVLDRSLAKAISQVSDQGEGEEEEEADPDYTEEGEPIFDPKTGETPTETKERVAKEGPDESEEEIEKSGGPFIGPRGGKWADVAHTIPWKEGSEASSFGLTAAQAREILTGELSVPKGWWIHGGKINKEFPAQSTADVDVAEQYENASGGGTIWLLRPNSEAAVVDFSEEHTQDMDIFVASVLEKLEGELDEEYGDVYDVFSSARDVSTVDDYSIENFAEDLRTSFAPENIVDTAQAYDAPEYLNLLESYPGGWPDFIVTPDGSVALPGAPLDKIDLRDLADLVRKSEAHAQSVNAIYDREQVAYARVKAVLKRKGYLDSDFEEGGPLYGYSVNALIEMAKPKS